MEVSILDRLQSVFVAAAAVAGLAVGAWLPVGDVVGHLVLPLLLVMIAAVFAQLNASRLREAGQARAVLVTSLVLNFVFTPALAWALGAGLLGDVPDLRIGLLLLLVTPCTDWYLVFTAMARGHGGIAAALLPVNLVLQLLLLPLYVLLLGGEAAMVDASTLTEAVLIALVVPFALALAVRWAAQRTKGEAWRDRLVVGTARAVVLPLLCLAVFAMFASQAETVVDHSGQLIRLLVPLVVFFLVAPLMATAVAKVLKLPADQRVTLTMVTTARNSPIALAIAVAAFPDRPLIAVALVVGPLLELPILSLLAQVVRAPAPAEARRSV